jgi:hypothetical protein
MISICLVVVVGNFMQLHVLIESVESINAQDDAEIEHCNDEEDKDGEDAFVIVGLESRLLV